MNSGLNYVGNHGVFSGIAADLCRVSNHIFFVFLFAFSGTAHFTNKIYWLLIGAYIQGILKGGAVGGRDGYPEGKIAEGSISHG